MKKGHGLNGYTRQIRYIFHRGLLLFFRAFFPASELIANTCFNSLNVQVTR
jgi:hypothetical protein